MAEVPRLPGENPGERRIREVLYFGLTAGFPCCLTARNGSGGTMSASSDAEAG